MSRGWETDLEVEWYCFHFVQRVIFVIATGPLTVTLMRLAGVQLYSRLLERCLSIALMFYLFHFDTKLSINYLFNSFTLYFLFSI